MPKTKLINKYFELYNVGLGLFLHPNVLYNAQYRLDLDKPVLIKEIDIIIGLTESYSSEFYGHSSDTLGASGITLKIFDSQDQEIFNVFEGLGVIQKHTDLIKVGAKIISNFVDTSPSLYSVCFTLDLTKFRERGLEVNYERGEYLKLELTDAVISNMTVHHWAARGEEDLNYIR